MRDQIHCVENISRAGVVMFRPHEDEVGPDENICWSLHVANPKMAIAELTKRLKQEGIEKTGPRYRIDAGIARDIAIKNAVHKLRKKPPKFRSYSDNNYIGYSRMLIAALILSVISSMALNFSLTSLIWTVCGTLFLVTVFYTVARLYRVKAAREFVS